MLEFFDLSIIPTFLSRFKVKKALIIGLSNKELIAEITSFCIKNNILLYAIDSKRDINDLFKGDELFINYSKENIKFFNDYSLNILPTLKSFDAIFINDDPNWYTVYNELNWIKENNSEFPMAFICNNKYPFKRRDAYINPEIIPEEFKNECCDNLPVIYETNDEIKHGAVNDNYCHAIFKDTPKNGVLTAIEDFLNENNSLKLFDINPFEGVILIYKDTTINKIRIDKILEENPFTNYTPEELSDKFIEHDILLNHVTSMDLSKEDFDRIDEYKSEIIKKNKQINDYKNKITLNNTQLDYKESQINTIKSQLNLKDTQIKNIEAKLSNKDTQIKNIEAKLSNKDTQIKNIEAKLSNKDTQIKNMENKLTSKDAQIKNMENKLTAKDNELKSKVTELKTTLKDAEEELNNANLEAENHRIIENKYKEIVEINKKELENNERLLKNNENNLKNEINSLKKLLDEKDNTITQKDEQLQRSKAQIKNENLRHNELKSKYNKQISKLTNKEYYLKCYEKQIKNSDVEIEYLKKSNRITKKISSPLAYLYILKKSNLHEIKTNIKLYKTLKNSKCFDIGYYLNKYPDIKKSKWCKYFSPELHYVCEGFNEKRKFNKKYFNDYDKRELIEEIVKMNN